MSSWNCHIFSQIICGSLPWLWATRLIINRNEKCPSLCENQWRKPCVIYRQNKPFCKSETVLFRLWIISKDCFFLTRRWVKDCDHWFIFPCLISSHALHSASTAVCLSDPTDERLVGFLMTGIWVQTRKKLYFLNLI